MPSLLRATHLLGHVACFTSFPCARGTLRVELARPSEPMRRGRGWRSNDSLAYLPVQSCQVLPESPFYILTRGEVVVRAKEGDETVCTKQAVSFFSRRAGMIEAQGSPSLKESNLSRIRAWHRASTVGRQSQYAVDTAARRPTSKPPSPPSKRSPSPPVGANGEADAGGGGQTKDDDKSDEQGSDTGSPSRRHMSDSALSDGDEAAVLTFSRKALAEATTRIIGKGRCIDSRS